VADAGESGTAESAGHEFSEDDSDGRPQARAPQPAGQPWSVLDCLKLWGAPCWIEHDSGELPSRLATVPSLAEFRGGREPAIDERVVQSFLTESGDALTFYDPAGIVPERWKALEPEVRGQWFAEVFSRLLRSEGRKRRAVLVVVEPAVAALMFYGILRMLPEGVREQTVSTFEGDPERAQGQLLGTWFAQPGSASALIGGLRWSGALVNTLAPAPPQASEQSQYASAMLRRLRESGWEAVDSGLEALTAAEVTDLDDLEPLTAVSRAIAAVLDQGAFPANEAWTEWPLAMAYLRHELATRLGAMDDLGEGLKRVVGGPAHLTVLDLLTNPKIRGTRKAIVHLLKELPPEKIIGLLRLSGVPDDDKITVLGLYIHGNGNLPPGCEAFWEDWAAAAEGPLRVGAVLMARVVAKLPPKDLKKFFRNAPIDGAVPFATNALKMYRQGKLKLESLTALFQAMDEATFMKVLRLHGVDLLKTYPANEPGLVERLVEVLYTLPKHPAEFRERMAFLLAAQHLLDEDHQKAVESWDACQQLIPKVASLQTPDPNTNPQMRITLLVSNCRDLAKAADLAMSLEAVDQRMTWPQKREALLRISQEVLGGNSLLSKGPWEHDAILDRIGIQFHQHRWPMEPLKKETPPPKKEGKRRLVGPEAKSMAYVGRGLTVVVLLMMVVFLGLVALLVYWIALAGSSEKEEPQQKRRRPKVTMPDGTESPSESSDSDKGSDKGGEKGRKREKAPSGAFLPLPEVPAFDPFNPQVPARRDA
jgi:hypothetical protein